MESLSNSALGLGQECRPDTCETQDSRAPTSMPSPRSQRSRRRPLRPRLPHKHRVAGASLEAFARNPALERRQTGMVPMSEGCWAGTYSWTRICREMQGLPKNWNPMWLHQSVFSCSNKMPKAGCFIKDSSVSGSQSWWPGDLNGTTVASWQGSPSCATKGEDTERESAACNGAPEHGTASLYQNSPRRQHQALQGQHL